MKHLLKRLSPFAPDQSGAVSVLFELGGLLAVCDAGGCTGNICGFDEPRWFTSRCALFSAALRDMDAILGRDDKLISKLETAMADTGCAFSALIGTPVPAVIATDFKALKRMAERRTGKPCIVIPTTGTNLYDRGAELTYQELFRTFAGPKQETDPSLAGVLGATPLDFSRTDAGTILQNHFHQQGWKNVLTYGMNGTLEDLQKASAAAKNFVVSPSGLSAAKDLERMYGTPWEICCPCLPEELRNALSALNGKKVLVIHQQFAANAVREQIDGDVVCASFFQMIPEVRKECDLALTGEESLEDAVSAGHFDVVIGDPVLKRVLRDFHGEFLPFRHFAVSGMLEEGTLL